MTGKHFLFALALGFVGFTGAANAATNVSDIRPTDIVYGDPKAPVTMVEYASMTCPHCAAFENEVMPLLIKEYVDTGKVKWIFRDFPLDGAATMAASLAHCFQGQQYYAFVSLVYKTQGDWWYKLFANNHQPTAMDVQESLAAVARMAGTGHDQALACEKDPKAMALVTANWKDATDRGVDSTPTFFINGQKAGPNSPDMKVVHKQFQDLLNPLVGKH